jgi:formate hydrogenlyase subunit 6/NADH:ubiquinone oxidoreductase subunit I
MFWLRDFYWLPKVKMIKSINNFFSGFWGIIRGLGITGNNAFRKSVTIEYPLDKPVMTRRFRGLVDLTPEKCIACSQCVKICPTAALELTSAVNPETKKRIASAFAYNSELCCYCGLCGEVCPTSAMFLNQCYEASYVDHKDMTGINLLDKNKYAHLSSPKSRGEKT